MLLHISACASGSITPFPTLPHQGGGLPFAADDCALNQSMISRPVAFHTPWRAQMWPSTSSRCRMRQGWPINTKRVELAGFWRHPVGLLVIAPVADIANAFGSEQVRGVRCLLEVGAGPADGARAGRQLDRRDRGANVLALLVF